ncbi:MAG: hypothetical protein QXV85_09955 [Candidatus Bathyarchaeia archaeon]
MGEDVLLRCPRCGGLNVQEDPYYDVRENRPGGFTVTRFFWCDDCGAEWNVVIEHGYSMEGGGERR